MKLEPLRNYHIPKMIVAHYVNIATSVLMRVGWRHIHNPKNVMRTVTKLVGRTNLGSSNQGANHYE